MNGVHCQTSATIDRDQRACRRSSPAAARVGAEQLQIQVSVPLNRPYSGL